MLKGMRGVIPVKIFKEKDFLAHTIDEYIEISQLIGAYKGYKKIIQTL